MTEEQRKLCRGLIVQFNGKRTTEPDAFLRQFPTAVEDGKLAARWLDEAWQAENTGDLECAMLVGFSFGFDRRHVEVLCRLLDVDWHYCHEDAVSALGHVCAEEAVDALFRATQWVPRSLAYDDARALAVKAIWALGNLTSAAAEAKLQVIARSDNAILQNAAAEQLHRLARRRAARSVQ